MTRWLKEPVLHFIVLGVALFTLYHLVAPPAPTKRIVLTDSVIRGLRQDHARRNGALPTPEEEAALIQNYIDDEVLYREALALGLERGDIIVRRRLVQKMEFLTEGLDPIPAATDEELRSVLDRHAERYEVPARVALTHVFASNDRHGSDVERAAVELRNQLLAGTDPSTLGDPFLRGRQFTLSTEQDLAAAFGASFAAQAMSMPIGNWSEPIRSSYGLHVVRVTEHSAARRPSVNDVRATLQRDWEEERRAAANRAALVRLRERYDIRIEKRPAPQEVAVSR